MVLSAIVVNSRAFSLNDDRAVLDLLGSTSETANVSESNVTSPSLENVTLSAQRLTEPGERTRNLSTWGRPACDARSGPVPQSSCQQALGLLPRDGRVVSFGRRSFMGQVNHRLPYTIISC